MSLSSQRPGSVTLIAGVNGVAAFLHLAFWTAVLVGLRSPANVAGLEPGALATIYGFGIADLLWSTPLLVASAVGLWRVRPWGWLFAQWCHVLYWYSLTVVLVRDAKTGSVSPGGLLFLPFAVFAVWATWRLWRERGAFFGSRGGGG